MAARAKKVRDKVVLAYSGGLDTSVAIRWLQQNYDLDVIAVSINVGQPGDLGVIDHRRGDRHVNHRRP